MCGFALIEVRPPPVTSMYDCSWPKDDNLLLAQEGPPRYIEENTIKGPKYDVVGDAILKKSIQWAWVPNDFSCT